MERKQQSDKKVKANRFAHTPDSPYGHGDYYGSIESIKTGKMIDSKLYPELPKISKTKPKSLA